MIGFPDAMGNDREHAWQDGARGIRLAMDNDSKCPVSGKRKYATEGAALATATHQLATANAPMQLRAYRCNWCKAWHLTKKTEKTGKDSG
jgi:hypothetical protein